MSFVLFCCFFFFKQKTAYEMRISDWSSDVCSSDLPSTWPRNLTYTTYTPDRSSYATQVNRLYEFERFRLADEWNGTSPVAYASPGNGKDRKSVVEGKSVSVRVDLGGRRIIKKKNILTP